MRAEDLIEALSFLRNDAKGSFFQRFFKTGKGQYAEGDIFWGISVPEQREVAKHFKSIALEELSNVIKSDIHEHRLTASIILVNQFRKGNAEKKAEIFNFYIEHIEHINNWDLVDGTAPTIVGEYLFQKNRDLLFQFASDSNLWKQRIAVIATMYFIKKHDFETTFELAKILLNHPHDLMHKAIGWMLREIGKKNYELEFEFLSQHYKNMPRTMLRYAIEKFDEPIRQQFLKGEV